jgi:hypothetical protein
MPYWSQTERLIVNLMKDRRPNDVQNALRLFGSTKHDLEHVSDFLAAINRGDPDATAVCPDDLRALMMTVAPVVVDQGEADALDQVFEMKTVLNVNLPGEEAEHLREKIARRMFGLDFVQLPKSQKVFLAKLLASVQARIDSFPQIEWTYSSEPSKEAAVILLSDHHFGKMVIDDKKRIIYNSHIARFRVGELLPRRIVKLLTRYLNPAEIDEVHVLMLGDIVDGHGIYPGQELKQDVHNFIDQAADATACIWNVIRAVRDCGQDWPVYVRGVRGNHGRQHKYAILENNFDYLVLQQLKIMAQYEDPGVDVDYGPEEYYNHEIKGWNVHLRHEAPEQPETPARKAKFAGWKDIHDYDMMVYGHKHHPANTAYQEAPLFMNSSPYEIDDLAERMATRSRPSQTLFGVSSRWGQTFHYNVYLDEVPDDLQSG